jgi:hypothetical protein
MRKGITLADLSACCFRALVIDGSADSDPLGFDFEAAPVGGRGGDECLPVAAEVIQGTVTMTYSVQGTPWPWPFQRPTSSIVPGSGS